MEYEQCKIEDCGNVAHSIGLCRAHYLQQYHGKDLAPVKQHPVEKCFDCEKPAYTAGYCRPHYDKNFLQTREQCAFEGCETPRHSRDFCRTHQKQLTSGATMRKLRPWVMRQGKGLFTGVGGICGVANCGQDAFGAGLCLLHAGRASRYGLDAEKAVEIFSITSCQVCGETTRLCIDHDHSCCAGVRSCGQCVRGVLCTWCNTTLGYAKEDIGRLEGLVTYLRT